MLAIKGIPKKKTVYIWGKGEKGEPKTNNLHSNHSPTFKTTRERDMIIIINP